MPEISSEAEEHAQEKQQAADCAVKYVQSGMLVGLGAGSTATLAIQRLGQLLREGQLRDIIGFPCSRLIEAEARSLGIPITLDPPDVVDLRSEERRVGKGGGCRW